MTHEQYLEAHHELIRKCLPQMALLIVKGEYEFLSMCMQALQRQLDAMWQERVATASAGVAP